MSHKVEGEWVTGACARRSPAAIVEPVVLLGTLGLLFEFRTELEGMSLVDLAQFTTVLSATLALLFVRSAPRRLWSPSSLYLVTFLVFHCGLSALVGFGNVDLREFPTLREWLYRPSTRTAMWLTAVGATSFCLGARLAHLRAPKRFRRPRIDSDVNTLMAFGGAVLVVFALALWFGIVIRSGGASLLVASYGEFLRKTGDTTMPFAYYALNLGIVMAAASRWTAWHRVTWGVFLVWSLIAFPLGLRGEILFPGAAALAIIATRRKMPSLAATAILAMLLLSSITAVRHLRKVGLSHADSASLSFHPLDGLAELGASLRPVSEVVMWHSKGEPLADGGTYWAPVDRLVYYVIPGWTKVPASEDPRLISGVVQARVGPIGFSPVAEAYWNYDALGVMFVLSLFGWILGRIDSWPETRIHQALAGLVMVAFLGHVRNVFVQVPAQLLVGVFALASIVVLARSQAHRRPARASPTAT